MLKDDMVSFQNNVSLLLQYNHHCINVFITGQGGFMTLI